MDSLARWPAVRGLARLELGRHVCGLDGLGMSKQAICGLQMIVRMAAGGVRQSEGFQNSFEIEDLARFAVDDYNKKQNGLLELKKVTDVKEQVVAGTMYYITLEAAEGAQKKVYEAKVWVKPWMKFKEVQEFKLVSDA
ncbi:UNVERIFIED_CONTAM: Cysteine proteinase inhibitor [Sesamum calycinum]|uniref:Cysteine proteinase inhibitor n=1 Tax=Sesamum calycinum TaxID=2727403 RepID=A0AAW2PKT6_9LAMI